MKLLAFSLATILLLVACSRAPTPTALAPMVRPVAEVQGVEAFEQTLIATAGACGFCHSLAQESGAAFSGGLPMSIGDRRFQGGSLLSVAARRSDGELRSFFRFGRYPESAESGHPFGHQGFEWVADRDLEEMIAYIRTLSASVEEDAPPSRGEGSGGWMFGLFGSSSSAAGDRTARRDVPGIVPGPSRAEPYSYGQYLLSSIARCQTCHHGTGGWFSSGDPFAGGRTVRVGDKSAIAPSLVDFAAEHSVEQIDQHLRDGTAANGKRIDPGLCPTTFTAAIPERERRALAHGLRTLAP